ncbi:flavin reductase family protein [Micromonospora sp. LOL_023]|uniref:flavin reductase family protein n=1 Tax=Micromonospora sp. LOL_023 TaxID=3345418 RepID=UPI003A844934
MSEQLRTATDIADSGIESISRAAFRDAMASFPTGVAIITTLDNKGIAYGLTASSFCSVSLHPPLVSFCVAKSANCFPIFTRCKTFAVSVLRPQHAMLARQFADRSADKFASGGFRSTELGLPVAEDALTVVQCRVHDQHQAGDHVIIVGEVLTADTVPGTPLVFVRRTFTQVVG